ncbi:hypothetical protein DKT68_12155 [Micromonospora acroterricola]|uniref:Uncharacterized protein n=1 Tax=Micromonospora acroterricola TaxID=2202421 RepID=A0A317D9N3_9ACTN|nr:hypothetical protein [Micromonospora acroterricola]PWR09503.1 hypothetical protein DKT68_12155 [Micromonospora acroterricola]
MSETRRLAWRKAALTFSFGYGLLRLYWAAGGRWGWTACDRTDPPTAVESATGCGADQVSDLPFLQGWGAVLLSGLLVATAVLAVRRPGRLVSVASGTAAVALVVLAFPAHLLFQVPAGLAGRPTDWRDVAGRLLLLTGGLLFGAVATARARCTHRLPEGPRAVPSWVRRWAYAACLVPVLGFSVPHALWLAGVPFGISAELIHAAEDDLSWTVGLSITLAPLAGGLLTLGLAQRWGQVFPHWLPVLGGHRVPRALALVPATVVALALIAYGLIGIWVVASALAAGTTRWSELAEGWLAAGTVLVFLAWGCCLAVATYGYRLVTVPVCAACDPSPAERRPVRAG